MKTLYALLLFGSFCVNAQIVSIPDVNFKSKLLSANATNFIARDQLGESIVIDINNDGEIQVSEALSVHGLFTQNAGINNFEGIQYFTNLRLLYCNYNNATTLNLSDLVYLERLYVPNMQLSSLDLSTLVNLEWLFCHNNNLTSLDLTGLDSLLELNCSSNPITSLGLSASSNLQILDCSNTQIAVGIFSNLPSLTHLSFRGNPATTLTVSDCAGIVHIDCAFSSFTDLTLTNLPALTTVYAYNNNLTALNFSGLPSFETFRCFDNQLDNIDTSVFPSLLELSCSANPLGTLDVSPLQQLQSLTCRDTGLSTLDLLQNTALTELNISNNFFTSFDFSIVPNLEYLDCGGNPMTEVDVSSLPSLSILSCYDMLIDTIDVTNNPLVGTIYANNNPNLISILMKNGMTGWGEGDLQNNPNLVFICADEGEILQLIQYLNFFGMTNVVVNSYCSLMPGGDFNTITGQTPFDANGDGCNVADTSRPYVKVKINDGTNTGASFVNPAGNYAFYTQAGTFELSTDIENPGFFNVSPTTATVVFPDNNNNVSTNNFCITPNGVHPDLEVAVFFNPPMPGFQFGAEMYIRNKGNQLLSGNATLNFDDAILDYLSSVPTADGVSPGSLTFNYTDLYPFESRRIEVGFSANSPTDTPPANIGDNLQMTATINPLVGDETPEDNTITFMNGFMGSFDPNNKICLEGDVVSTNEIGKYLHYMINFENTGNAAAQNIVVTDIINPAQFEIESLQLLYASHPVTARVNGSTAEFIFENIQLEPGGHGNILMKIKTLPTLTSGSTVSNKADIYFDYNAPVITDFANTQFQSLAVNEHNFNETISIFPNPATNVINVSSRKNITSVQLIDVQGRVLRTMLTDGPTASVDITESSSGVYLLRVTTDGGVKTQKIIKN